MMPPRGAAGSCRRRRLAPLNEDNGRFLLLAALIAAYLSAGATVFSALESPSEAAAQLRWNRTLHNFSRIFNISLPELRAFLRSYEAAMAAGIRVDALRPRWDFPGAFYFVGTVVSTIGERPPGEGGMLRPRLRGGRYSDQSLGRGASALLRQPGSLQARAWGEVWCVQAPFPALGHCSLPRPVRWHGWLSAGAGCAGAFTSISGEVAEHAEC